MAPEHIRRMAQFGAGLFLIGATVQWGWAGGAMGVGLNIVVGAIIETLLRRP